MPSEAVHGNYKQGLQARIWKHYQGGWKSTETGIEQEQEEKISQVAGEVKKDCSGQIQP